jgi:hypothetical protein
LIAGEEELVVAIFEWLKLNEDRFPEHKDFVRKFKNHVVKLSFYPVLSQFRFIIADMLRDGLTIDGLEDVMSWRATPVIDNNNIKLALVDSRGKELFRHNPLAVDISQGDARGKAAVPILLEDFRDIIRSQHGGTIKEFLLERADFRNKLLYASDAGSAVMGDSLADLIEYFKQTYHDLLWVLAILIGAEMPNKRWGLVSQFIGLYRSVLIEAGVLRVDNTIAAADDGRTIEQSSNPSETKIDWLWQWLRALRNRLKV